MKKIVILAIILGILLSLTAAGYCEEDEITQTIKTFYQSMEKGDMLALLQTMSPDVVNQIKNAKTYEDLQKIGGSLGAAVLIAAGVKKGTVTVAFENLLLTPEGKAADSATVSTTYIVNLKEIESGKETKEDSGDIVTMKLIEGKWLIESLVDSKGKE